MTDHKQQFAARLNEAMAEKGLPERGRAKLLADKFSVSPKAAGKWIKGEAFPEMEKLIDISRFVEKEVEWLLTGNKGDTESRFEGDIDTSLIASVTYAPVLSWVQAGNWTDMQDINLQECEMLPLVPGAGKRSFYLEVRGLSNFPYFEEGEKICIDPDWQLEDIQTGEMVVVKCEGKATFKALISEPNSYHLKALNPNWESKIIPLNENCVLVGKYVGSFRPAKRYFIN